jgi:hypothetical protein
MMIQASSTKTLKQRRRRPRKEEKYKKKKEIRRSFGNFCEGRTFSCCIHKTLGFTEF